MFAILVKAASGPASAISQTPIPSFFGETTPRSTVGALSTTLQPLTSEREKLINTLARHCTAQQSGEQQQSGTIDIGNSGTLSISNTVYRSTNSKVLDVLDILRRDLEKSQVICFYTHCRRVANSR